MTLTTMHTGHERRKRLAVWGAAVVVIELAIASVRLWG